MWLFMKIILFHIISHKLEPLGYEGFDVIVEWRGWQVSASGLTVSFMVQPKKFASDLSLENVFEVWQKM